MLPLVLLLQYKLLQLDEQLSIPLPPLQLQPSPQQPLRQPLRQPLQPQNLLGRAAQQPMALQHSALQ